MTNTIDTVGLTPAQNKVLITLAARLALAGIELHVLPRSGGYLLLVCNQTRHCRTLAQLEAAAQRILGEPG